MTHNPELKPCPNPWCPEVNSRIVVWDLYSKRVVCTCGVKGPRSETKANTFGVDGIRITEFKREEIILKEAITAWNTRATPEPTAKATLQRVCGNLRNDGYSVPISVLTRAIEFLRPSEFGEYCSTPEPQGYNEWIWASFLDPTDDCGSFCAPRPHMNGGPPNNDAIKYIRADIYETQAKRIKELEAAEETLEIVANVLKDTCESRDLHITELEAANEWQPIETAPKGDTDIILAYSLEGMDIAWWSEGQNDWLTLETGTYLADRPTHWQPLPTPPKTEETP